MFYDTWVSFVSGKTVSLIAPFCSFTQGIREEDHYHWYKRMYESLHRAGGPG